MLHIWNIIVLIGLHIAYANEYLSVPRRYALHLTQSTWRHGQTDCKGSGGRLATIYDYSTIPDLDLKLNTGDLFWIGLHRNDTIQDFVWDNGDSITWYNWKTGVNDNQTALCVAASVVKPYSWEIVDCERLLPYLCQHADGECRFVEYQNMSIASHNYMYLYRKSEKHCKNVCANEQGSRCRSFDYFPADGRCEFNSGNRWTLDGYYNYRRGWVYYHRTCNSAEVLKVSVTPSPTLGCLQTTNVFVTSSHVVTSTHDVFVSRDAPVTRDIIVTSTQIYKTTVTVTETSTHVIVASPTVIFPSASAGEDPVEELKEIGEVAAERKKTLKKISVQDNRPSAKYVGYVAIAFMSCVFGAIVLFDIISLCRYLTCCNEAKKLDFKHQNDNRNLQKYFYRTKMRQSREHNIEKEEIEASTRQTNGKSSSDVSNRPSHDEDPTTSSSSELYQRSGQRSKMIWRPFVLNMGDSGIEGSDVSSSPYQSDSGSDTFHFSYHRTEEHDHRTEEHDHRTEEEQDTNDSEHIHTSDDEYTEHIYQITHF